jgi:hypothetical protein
VLVAAIAMLVAAAAFFVPYLTKKREVVESTPSVAPLPPGGLVPMTLQPGDDLCLPDIPLTPRSEVVRFSASAPGGAGGPLEVSLKGPGLRSATRLAGGWRNGMLDVPLSPPRSSVRGSICIKNVGSRPASVMGTEPGQKFARPTPLVNGVPHVQDVPMTFHRRSPASLVARTGDVVDHAAVFSPIPAPLLWALLFLVLLGIPALALRALASAVSEDG